MEELLQQKKLRITKCRLDVLALMGERKEALSHADLEQVLTPEHDRVTLYRTLKTYLEKDIVHKVLDDSGAVKYALCSHDHSHAVHDEEHSHDHVHFKCEVCGKTTCVESAVLPKIKLPQGFVEKEVNLLIQGICQQCNR
ncbi:Fur family ferric uptake regulator [Nitritalea halalkaliphila LW7]|uniref:Fur family ferric uptake regulator n=1 Tax=Nitritalea halalkaliphila LW7 TaxID=1189621 RepID=I5BWS2_9BACT|nr:transcriptional repressor [Nitritalea halalkaliphila]EIM74024.1 Fur family ferric uptake regulator [Nitritalea halalkaliphila LW7]